MNKWKSWPKDAKIIRPVQKNVILTLRELPFSLLDHLFGSLIPVNNYENFWLSPKNYNYNEEDMTFGQKMKAPLHSA